MGINGCRGFLLLCVFWCGMSGIRETQSGGTGEVAGSEEEFLSTGLENFDQAFRNKGIRIGTIVCIVSDPRSPSETLLSNMIANRPAFYFTTDKGEEQISRNIKHISNVNADKVEIIELNEDVGEHESMCETAISELEDSEIPRGSSIILDSVNAFEEENRSEYNKLLTKLYSVVNEQGSLGIINAVKSEHQENRWVSEQIADTVFELNHVVRDETIADQLSVEKLYPGQEFTNEDTQVFDLTRGLDIDIASNRNVSP